MDLTVLTEYINPALLILIPTCLGLGMVLKSLPLPNKLIPLILCCCAIALAMLNILSGEVSNYAAAVFAGITQGVVCWLVSWLTYEKFIKKTE